MNIRSNRCFLFGRWVAIEQLFSSRSVVSGPFVTLCRRRFSKSHFYRWDIDGNEDANEYRRFNLGGTVNFWFVNRGLTGKRRPLWGQRDLSSCQQDVGPAGLYRPFSSRAKSSMLIELQTTSRKRYAIYFSVCTFFAMPTVPRVCRANSMSKWSKIFIE